MVLERPRRRESAKASTEFGGETEREDIEEARDLFAASVGSAARRKVLRRPTSEPWRADRPPSCDTTLLESSIALSGKLRTLTSFHWIACVSDGLNEAKSGRSGLLPAVPRRARLEDSIVLARGMCCGWKRWSSRSMMADGLRPSRSSDLGVSVIVIGFVINPDCSRSRR